MWRPSCQLPQQSTCGRPGCPGPLVHCLLLLHGEGHGHAGSQAPLGIPGFRHPMCLSSQSAAQHAT
jgi:hypothetical protein